MTAQIMKWLRLEDPKKPPLLVHGDTKTGKTEAVKTAIGSIPNLKSTWIPSLDNESECNYWADASAIVPLPHVFVIDHFESNIVQPKWIAKLAVPVICIATDVWNTNHCKSLLKTAKCVEFRTSSKSEEERTTMFPVLSYLCNTSMPLEQRYDHITHATCSASTAVNLVHNGWIHWISSESWLDDAARISEGISLYENVWHNSQLALADATHSITRARHAAIGEQSLKFQLYKSQSKTSLVTQAMTTAVCRCELAGRSESVVCPPWTLEQPVMKPSQVRIWRNFDAIEAAVLQRKRPLEFPWIANADKVITGLHKITDLGGKKRRVFKMREPLPPIIPPHLSLQHMLERAKLRIDVRKQTKEEIYNAVCKK